MTGVIAPHGVLLIVPTDSVLPNPANPRRTVTVDDELVASIKAHGLIHPPVVRLIDDDQVGATDRPLYELLAGHRRHAASIEAGLDEIPVLLRDEVDDETALELMLVENLARHQLSPTEEADGYEALRRLGLSQRDIAGKVGVNQGTVSKRLSLLKLPDVARDAVDAGRITLEDGQALAKLGAVEVNRLWAHGQPTASAVRQTIDAHERDEKRAKARAQAEKEGMTVIDVAPSTWLRHPEQPNADHPVTLSVLASYGMVGDDHDQLACHAVSLTYEGELRAVCTDPQSHRPEPDKDETVAVGERETTPDPDAVERQARAEATMAVRERRLDHVRGYIHGLGAGDVNAALPAIVELAVWTFATVDEIGHAGLDLVGLDWTSWDTIAPAWHRYVSKGNANQARALLAQAAELAEDEMPAAEAWSGRLRQDNDDESILVRRAWLTWLADHGYQLDPDEEQLANQRTNPEAIVTVGHVDQDGTEWVVDCSNCDDDDLDDRYQTQEAAEEAAAGAPLRDPRPAGRSPDQPRGGR